MLYRMVPFLCMMWIYFALILYTCVIFCYLDFIVNTVKKFMEVDVTKMLCKY